MADQRDPLAGRVRLLVALKGAGGRQDPEDEEPPVPGLLTQAGGCASVVRALEAAHPFAAVRRCAYPRPGWAAMRADGVKADRQRGA
jgi:hypothetical protein